MRKGETSRLEEFWRNQQTYGPGTRIGDGDRPGFIINWRIVQDFPMRGSFSVLYDNGDYREYDAIYFRYIRRILDSTSRWLNSLDAEKDSYRRYCDNLFLAKLIEEDN